MELEALIAFAPSRMRDTIEIVNNPVRAAELKRLSTNPSAIKRLPAPAAVTFIGSIDDPVMLNRFRAVGDQRTSVRKAFSGHRLLPRADDLMAQVPSLLRDVDVDGCVPPLEELAPLFDAGIAAGVVRWVRSLPADQQAKATVVTYLTLHGFVDGFNRPFRKTHLLSALALDVILGRVQGLEYETLIAAGSHLDSFAASLNPDNALTKVHTLSPAEAVTLCVSKLSVPYGTVDRLTPEVVYALLGFETEIALLMDHGYVSDAPTIISACDGVSDETLRAVLQRSTDNDVAEALVPRLRFQGRRRMMTGQILNSYPELSASARAIVLSNASLQDIRQYLIGRFYSFPRTGEIAASVDELASGDLNITLEMFVGVIQTFEPGRYTGPISEAMDALLDVAKAQLLLSKASELGKRAVDRIIESCGSDKSTWNNLASLAREWDGDLNKLVSSATLLG